MKKQLVFKILHYVILSLFTVVMIYPVLYMVLGSLCTPEEFAHSGLLPIPKNFTFSRLSNFLLLFDAEGVGGSIFFTIARAIYYCVVVIFTSMLLGYIFAKMQFRGKRAVFMFFMISMMIPGVATIVPNYILFARFPLVGGNDITGYGGQGFIDNPSLMFITGLFGIYNIFLVRQSIVGLGDEYKEAAEIDGANMMRIIFLIYMPMLLPVLIVTIVGMFNGMWNDYFFTMMYAIHSEVRPIGYYITEIISRYRESISIYTNYPAILAVSTTFSILPIVVYLCLQKHLTQGMTIGGIKG